MIWALLAGLVAVPVIVAAQSELLNYRDWVYIAAGFAGVIGMTLLMLQPLLASAVLPGVPAATGQKLHRWGGSLLVLAIAVHVAGLWITSPPDMIDALTFTAPTAFSAFGVVAMWALLAAAFVARFRRRLRLRPALWRAVHISIAAVVVVSSAAHAVLIEGTMGTLSKYALCVAVMAGLGVGLWRRRPWGGIAPVNRAG